MACVGFQLVLGIVLDDTEVKDVTEENRDLPDFVQSPRRRRAALGSGSGEGLLA